MTRLSTALVQLVSEPAFNSGRKSTGFGPVAHDANAWPADVAATHTTVQRELADITSFQLVVSHMRRAGLWPGCAGGLAAVLYLEGAVLASLAARGTETGRAFRMFGSFHHPKHNRVLSVGCASPAERGRWRPFYAAVCCRA